MSNHLAGQLSPYLLQHADNPVDWRPWGEEALKKAREEDKPIFLSVGYATCHWCHVMAHESFEDPAVAAVLNEHFVPIKVDREERPDVDQVYMAACQALTGQGGWPLSVFLTPEGKPFFAGTYFPKASAHGRPGFMDLLRMLAEKWRTDRDVVVKAAEQLTQAAAGPPPQSGAMPGASALRLGYAQLSRSFDHARGGFGQAPKFPTPHYLTFLLRWHHRHADREALEMVIKTLTEMRRGGIWDHLGGGFHRYSVDAHWLVPHFEKMLYDQALLALAYAEAHAVTGDDLFARTARETFAYVQREMTGPEGGFHAAEDADSEGREGAFYVWRREDVLEALGAERGARFCRYYDVTDKGNFERGESILHEARSLKDTAVQEGMDFGDLEAELAAGRDILFRLRARRPRPLKDDKILTAWNGLMIAALAAGGRLLGDAGLIGVAARAADFLLASLSAPDGGLLRSYRSGRADIPGFLDDYAFLAWGLIELHQAGFETRWLAEADRLTRVMLRRFKDPGAGGLYYTPEGSELVTRKKDAYDGATPSGNAVAAVNLIRLSRLTGDMDLAREADAILSAFSGDLGQYAMAHTHMLQAVDYAVGPSSEVVIAAGGDGDEARRMTAALAGRFLARTTVHVKASGGDADLERLAPFTASMTPVDGRTAMYRCRDFACARPVLDPQEAAALLDEGLSA